MPALLLAPGAAVGPAVGLVQHRQIVVAKQRAPCARNFAYRSSIQCQSYFQHEATTRCGRGAGVVAFANVETVEVDVDLTAGEKQEDAPGLLLLDKGSFYPYLNENADKLTVVDFYTDWCGPCKLIYPELVKLNQELGEAVNIVKFNCNKENKELGVKLNIRVAPTFQLYRGGAKVAEMTGAKLDKLKALIEEHKAAA